VETCQRVDLVVPMMFLAVGTTLRM